jgi:hypothetical protein
MKKVIIIFSILLMGLTMMGAEGEAKFSLSKPERKTVKIDGKEYTFLLYKYDPPYSHVKPYKGREEADCSTPEGTDLALCSAVGRDRDWYLSLHDKSGKEVLFGLDRKSKGKVLEEYNKDKLLPKDLTKTEMYPKYLYKVELEFESKQYAIILERWVFEGKEEMDYHSYTMFVKQGDIWLRTDDLKDHPVGWLVGLKSYDEVQKLCRKGKWFTPTYKKPDPLKVTLESAKKKYKLKEPFIFKVKVTNISDEDVHIFGALSPAGRSVTLSIRDKREKGKVSYGTPSLKPKPKPVESDFITLSPDSSIEAAYEIEEYYKGEAYEEGKGKYLASIPFSPGEYTVQATYSYFSEAKTETLTGYWNSNPIEITVLPE